MTGFDPYWLGLDYVIDSTPGDGDAIMFFPSIVNDAAAGYLQAESESSALSFMQDSFRSAAMNMLDSGLVVNALG